MSFEHTDFNEAQFDLVFAQASISNLGRKSIVKEVKRILKPNGIFVSVKLLNLRQMFPFLCKIFLMHLNLNRWN
ncbi:MAG: methyltransferase domain-containing protein [Ignavibacteriales bacterium]|nr:methyltransferase domain-containing protein [Ignavibacteriales bacterium]